MVDMRELVEFENSQGQQPACYPFQNMVDRIESPDPTGTLAMLNTTQEILAF